MRSLPSKSFAFDFGADDSSIDWRERLGDALLGGQAA